MANRFSIEATFRAIDRISAPVARMQAKMQRFTDASDRIGKRFAKVDAGLSRISGGLQAFGTAGVVAAGTVGVALADVVRIGADFEQTLTNAAAKFPDGVRVGTKAFTQLEEAAKRVGGQTEFTASQAAGALDFLAMAGFNVEQSIGALPQVVDLATASGMDLARATDIASDALGAFGLATKDPIGLAKNLARINDVLAKTSTTSNTTIEAMFEAMKEAGPVGTSVGASLETVSALIGTLANAGIKGSVAGTTLKNVFTNLSAPTGQAAKALKRLGIQTKDSEGNVRDVISIFGDLQKRLDGMGTADRAMNIESIFGKIPLAGVNVLLGAGADKLAEYRAQLEGAGGAAATMAGQMRDTVGGKLKGLSSAFEALKLEAFDAIKQPLGELVDKTTEWFRANKDVFSDAFRDGLAFMRDTLPVLVDKLARIGKLVGTFYAIQGAIKVATAAVGAFNLVASFGWVGLLVAGIALALSALYTFWPEISAWFAELWDSISTWFNDKLLPAIQPGIDAVIGFFKTAGAFFSGVATMAWEFWKGVWDSAAPYFSALWDGITGTLRAVWDVIGPYFSALWDGIATAASVAFDGLLAAGKFVVDRLLIVFDELFSFIGAMWDVTLGPVVDALGKFGSMAVEVGSRDSAPTATPQVISAAHEQLQATREVHDMRGEVTIKDETGRAEVTTPRGNPRRALAMRLAPSGAV